MNVKTFAFQVWCSAGKDWTQAATLCEQLASNQFTVAQANGAALINVSLNGKTFGWQVDPAWTVSDIAEVARRTWALIQTAIGPNPTATVDDLTAFVSSPTPSRTYGRWSYAYAG